MTETSRQVPNLQLSNEGQEEVVREPEPEQDEDTLARARTHDDRHAHWELRRRDPYAA